MLSNGFGRVAWWTKWLLLIGVLSVAGTVFSQDEDAAMDEAEKRRSRPPKPPPKGTPRNLRANPKTSRCCCGSSKPPASSER